MNKSLNNKYIERQQIEITDFPNKKLPVVFCIDVSNSMNSRVPGTPFTVMDNLRKGVEGFHNAMVNDRKASVSCQTAYITFGERVTVIEDFGLVKNKQAPIDKLIAKDNCTYIVDALKTSLAKLDEQKALLNGMKVDYHQPWLVIFTDGQTHDDDEKIKEIKNELLKRQRDEKLTVYTIALSSDQEMYQQIRGYSMYKPIPYDENNIELSNFFNYLTRSVSGLSNGRITGRISPFTQIDEDPMLQ